MKPGAAHWLLLGMILVASGCSDPPTAPPAEAGKAPVSPIDVTVAPVVERSIQRTTETVGTLLADDQMVLSNQAEGVLASISVDLGSVVRKGQVIAQIDAREFQLRLDQSLLALEQARARLGLHPEQSDEIDPQATPVVRQARAAHDDAEIKYQSAKKLFATGDISEQRYIEAEKTFMARKAALQAAIDGVHEQLAGIRRLRAEIALAQKQLSDATIGAPLTGSVSVKHASAGEYLKVGAPIVTIVKGDPLRLRISIPEVYSAAVHKGQSVKFMVDAFAGRTFSGVIERINPALDPQSRIRYVEAMVKNPDLTLAPGMFARVRLVVDPAAKALMVPEKAVVYLAGVAKLFVIERGTAVERVIQPGVKQGELIEVSDGVKAGEQVALANLDQLTGGQPVRVVARESLPVERSNQGSPDD